MAKLLLVDDDESFAEVSAELLESLGHEVLLADSVVAAKKLLESHLFDHVFLDLMLPDGSGFHILENIPLGTSKTRATIITGHSRVKEQVMGLYGPNVNYLIKPISLEQLSAILEKHTPDNDSNISLHFGELIGESDIMANMYDMISRVAATDANVMLFGESGVGKEVFARAIHRASSYTGKIVATNCGALSTELLGSELFGHEKGAFTGASDRRSGIFEQASNGTVFLDEITEMPITDQPSLLRVLETRTVTRLGGNTATPVKCRVISATNRSEKLLARENCLREDLYYRLAVFPIHIPPLRERGSDISLLANHFLELLNTENGTSFKLSPEAIERLMDHDWPGNVRELRHTIQRAWIMTDPEQPTLTLPDTFESPFSQKAESNESLSQVGRTIEDVEKELILTTLREFSNKTKAAEVLGVSVKTLYNRLNEYEKIEEKDNG